MTQQLSKWFLKWAIAGHGGHWRMKVLVMMWVWWSNTNGVRRLFA